MAGWEDLPADTWHGVSLTSVTSPPASRPPRRSGLVPVTAQGASIATTPEAIAVHPPHLGGQDATSTRPVALEVGQQDTPDVHTISVLAVHSGRLSFSMCRDQATAVGNGTARLYALHTLWSRGARLPFLRLVSAQSLQQPGTAAGEAKSAPPEADGGA